jgi:very-short-patch-repair endonuclease
MVKQARQEAKRKALLEERAHFMRHNPTETEQMLWRCLSGKKLGVAFRRQVLVGEFIVDFLAPSVKLVVEVDGGYHAERVTADGRRQRALERLGYRVVRVSTEAVRANLEKAVNTVRQSGGIRLLEVLGPGHFAV